MRISPHISRALAVLGVAGGLTAGALALTLTIDARPARATPAPPASLTAIACRSTLDPTSRRVSVESVMGHLPGTRTLSARLVLIEQQPGQPAQPVAGGDLGRWLTPAIPTLGRNPDDVWRLAKAVYDIGAPAAYHFVVEFRWIGVGGRILAHRTLSSDACTVRELRPNLLVRSVRVVALARAPHHERYVATIVNAGATASGPFSVSFTPATGIPAHTQPVASLAPHSGEPVTFIGPLCDPADPPTVIADPGGAVDDFNRADNTLTVSCPAA